MTADLTRLTSIDRSTAPSAPVGSGSSAVAPSRAVTRPAPVDPNDAIGAQPLGRSGLDLVDLFAVSDEVAVRESTGSVAREAGLEHTRGLLLRNQPGEALASLDTVWEGARHSEEGWYLRSGALTVLGLPGESERVADEGLALRPSSMALRFLQSFARLTLGDFPGARAALELALERAPAEPLLLVQRALVQAKQGDVSGANAQLQQLATIAPEHPTIAWGRAMLRSTAADAARRLARPTPVTGAQVLERMHAPAIDPATLALERFGECMATGSTIETTSEARMLMRAFSTGGALASTVTPEHAHAVRILLTTYLAVASGAGTAPPSPLRSVMATLLPLVQAGRSGDAEGIVRRQRPLLREPIGRLLLDVLRGAQGPETALPKLPTHEAPAVGTPPVRGDPESGPLIPVRLGLGLLEETPASRVALDPMGAAWTATGFPFAVREDGTVIRYMMSGSMQAIPESGIGRELDGHGWGAARSAADTVATGPSERTPMTFRVVAFLVLMVGALATGHWLVAIVLSAAAAAVALHRRGGNAGDRDLDPSDEADGTDAHQASSLR